jgi:putative transposase
MLTPADVHYGRTELRVTRNQATLSAAYAEHPERFVHGPPVARRPPTEVWINKPDSTAPGAPASQLSDSTSLQ